MNYNALVPSLELCRELERWGICQDGAELWYQEGELRPSYIPVGTEIIAPTLPRLMEEIPDGTFMRKHEGFWDVYAPYKIQDKHLPNAIAKALISIKLDK